MSVFYTADRSDMLAVVAKHWRRGLITDAQCVALYLLVLTRSRYQCRWLQELPGAAESRARRILSTGQLPDSLCLRLGEAVPELAEAKFSLIRFFACYRPKGMRQGAHVVLSQWLNAPLPLFTIVGPMSSTNLLRWQSQGYRCVSIFQPPCDWDRPLVADKDALDFTLHDLDHAFKFICDGSSYYSQVGFFSCLDHLVAADSVLSQWRAIDAEFDRALVYLMSDMNTHCAHQTEYLKAIVVESLLRRHALGRNEPLSDSAQHELAMWKRGVENILGMILFDMPLEALTQQLEARGREIIQRDRAPPTAAQRAISIT